MTEAPDLFVEYSHKEVRRILTYKPYQLVHLIAPLKAPHARTAFNGL